MNSIHYIYVHVGQELPSTLLRRKSTEIAWNHCHLTSCNSHIDAVSEQVWLPMHVRKPFTQSHFWPLAFELGAVLRDDSSTNLFLNCRITPKPTILTNLIWRTGISKIILVLSVTMVLSYCNSHLPPAAKGQLQKFKRVNTLHCLCHAL